MRRGTTPTLKITLNGMKIEELVEIYVILTQGNYIKMVKNIEELKIIDDVIYVELTQEETLSFNANQPLNLQVRAKTDIGEAVASDIMRLNVKEILWDEVI